MTKAALSSVTITTVNKSVRKNKSVYNCQEIPNKSVNSIKINILFSEDIC